MGYIDYSRLNKQMADKGLTSYRARVGNIIGQATWRKIQAGRSGRGQDIDTRTIAALCEALECQPGDILEYVPEVNEDA